MYRAIIIDDERPARQAIAMLGHWEKHGIEPPLEAADVQSALTLMSIYCPNIVFLDMRMPVMSGLDFLRQASPIYPDAKFIVVSGYDEFEYARQSLRHGAIEYLLKPVIEAELDGALSRVVSLLNAEESKANENMSIFVRYLRGAPLESIEKKRPMLKPIIDFPDFNASAKYLRDYLDSLAAEDSAEALQFFACEIIVALREKALTMGLECARRLIPDYVNDARLGEITSKNSFVKAILEVHEEIFRTQAADEHTKAVMVEEIRNYISGNYAEDIRLSQFSEKYFVTKEYLSRCFKEIMGCGIYEYVTRTRMEIAKELLENPENKIRVVAGIVGYNDQNYFSRAFKKHFGEHPTDFRTRMYGGKTQ